MQKIKGIFFDFGGVVVSEGFNIWCANHINTKKIPRHNIDVMDQKVDKGQISVKEYSEFLAQASGENTVSIEEEILLGYTVNSALCETIEQIHNKAIKTAIISNFPKEWFWKVYNKFHLQTLFDRVIVSSEIGFIKPDPNIFYYALRQDGFLPEETLFIDDKEQMVQSAKTIGMQGLVFTSVEDFQRKLPDLGILL